MQLLTEEKDDQKTLQHELAFKAPEKNLDHCNPARDSKISKNQELAIQLLETPKRMLVQIEIMKKVGP